ncbi:hypothetical protein C0J52_23006 [Blattella germanica]|nr:hypothetical protein C0J52_23006 [Blattella germanica]
MLKTMNARTFWEQRVAEQMASSQEQITEMWQCRENSVWASIYGTRYVTDQYPETYPDDDLEEAITLHRQQASNVDPRVAILQ